jgi:hypothetical protein
VAYDRVVQEWAGQVYDRGMQAIDATNGQWARCTILSDISDIELAISDEMSTYEKSMEILNQMHAIGTIKLLDMGILAG